MRVIVARCEVVYSGRLNALLPEATRLLLVKSDGSVLVHSDAGGYKPQNSDLRSYSRLGPANRQPLAARNGPTGTRSSFLAGSR